MTPHEFVTARLDEYEAALQDATSGPPFSPVATSGGAIVHAALYGELESAAWLHRDLAAKRAILAEHVHIFGPSWCSTCDVPGDMSNRGYGCLTIRALAAPYADHPDYRQEWKP